MSADVSDFIWDRTCCSNKRDDQKDCKSPRWVFTMNFGNTSLTGPEQKERSVRNKPSFAFMSRETAKPCSWKDRRDYKVHLLYQNNLSGRRWNVHCRPSTSLTLVYADGTARRTKSAEMMRMMYLLFSHMTHVRITGRTCHTFRNERCIFDEELDLLTPVMSPEYFIPVIGMSPHTEYQARNDVQQLIVHIVTQKGIVAGRRKSSWSVWAWGRIGGVIRRLTG